MCERLLGFFVSLKSYFFIGALLLTVSVYSSDARAACGFDTIGDYTCAQPTGGTGGGGSTSGGGAGFNGADLLANTIIPGLDPTACGGTTGSIATLFGTLPSAMQNGLATQLMSALAVGNCGSLNNILGTMTDLSVYGAGISDDMCSGGGGSDPTGNDATVGGSFTALLMNMIGLDLSFSTGSLTLNMGSLTTDICGQLNPCGAGGGGGGGGGGGASCSPVNSGTIDQDIKDHLKLREGVRRCAYQDSLGKWTIGVGHLIKDTDPYPKSTSTCISDAEVDSLLQSDMAWAVSAAQSQMAELGLNCHDFLVDLVSVNYQLGAGWRTKFPTTWSQMQAGNYSEAADGLESSLWNQQTPVRVDDFQAGLRQLDGAAPAPSGCTTSPGGGGGGGGGSPGADALGKWCPDSGAASYAIDSSLPGTYNITETDPGMMIAESAMMSVGATTADHDGVTSPKSGTRGGLGCALAVSRILMCAGIDQPEVLGTATLYTQFENDPCYDLIDTGSVDASLLQPGDIINTATGSGGSGHIGIYIGDGNIVSNSSTGYAGSNGQSEGGVKQNYTVDSWNSGVVTRGGTKTGVFRRTCPI